MEAEQTGKMIKKPSSIRKKPQEAGEFQSQLTLQLDQFYRHFNYYYPGKNKEEIINKCLTGNIYWITLDSLYYPDNVDFEAEKIALFRKKAQLKNGTFPPTRDSLEEQKYILALRKITSANLRTLNLMDIRDTPIGQVQEYLQNSLLNQEYKITQQLSLLNECLARENVQIEADLERLTIPIIKSSKLFAYEQLQKEVINSCVLKAAEKQKEPRCDFCFTRDKEILKCRSCSFYTHLNCFPRLHKDVYLTGFQCDGCQRQISSDSHCQLCPTKQGHFLQLNNNITAKDYKLARGESNLKFKVVVLRKEGELERSFIHVSCYVLHPECTYNPTTGLVEGLHLIDRNRKNMNNCSLCGNMLGMTVPCNNDNCRRSFHPECAKRNSLNINVIKANNKALLQIYCERHKKPESFQYLKDSSSNRIRQLRKFYENVDYQLKRSNVFHNAIKAKKQNKNEELLKQDRCLHCGIQNDYERSIVNCMRCYGWHHQICCNICPYCDA